MPSSTVENYLKAILQLADGGGEAPTVAVGQIATHLGLTPGTVTTMMKHLSKEGFIHYLPRRGVCLTPAGEKLGLQIVRRHRLIELFLVEVMQLDWAHVHEEAEVLEHVLSDRMVERIDEMLGRPAYDPHGEPIPDADGLLRRDDDLRSLNDCGEDRVRLVRVSRDDPPFLVWLQEHGLRPGASLEVVSRDPVGEILTLEVAGRAERVRISTSAAGTLWVKGTTPERRRGPA
jgi:DtxR family Mn-dependent transcriptional regulator